MGLNVTFRLLGLFEDEGDTIHGLVSLLTGSFRILTPHSHFCQNSLMGNSDFSRPILFGALDGPSSVLDESELPHHPLGVTD